MCADHGVSVRKTANVCAFGITHNTIVVDLHQQRLWQRLRQQRQQLLVRPRDRPGLMLRVVGGGCMFPIESGEATENKKRMR